MICYFNVLILFYTIIPLYVIYQLFTNNYFSFIIEKRKNGHKTIFSRACNCILNTKLVVNKK